MQYGQEHGALQRELVPALARQLCDHRAAKKRWRAAPTAGDALFSHGGEKLAALSAPRYGLKKEAVITPQIAVVLPLTLVLLIATLVLVSLAMRE